MQRARRSLRHVSTHSLLAYSQAEAKLLSSCTTTIERAVQLDEDNPLRALLEAKIKKMLGAPPETEPTRGETIFAASYQRTITVPGLCSARERRRYDLRTCEGNYASTCRATGRPR